MTSGELKFLGIIIGAVALFVSLALWSASNESRTFNKLTGAQTTTWDALWTELRVQAPPTNQGGAQ